MMKSEFGAISRRLNVGGDCADYMWDDIELFYMSYDSLDKDDCARIYWNHTGYFEQMVQKLKEVRELAKENHLASWQIVPFAAKMATLLHDILELRKKIAEALEADKAREAKRTRRSRKVAA